MVKSGHWDAHPHVRTGKDLTLGERAADVLKKWMGTWSILGLIGAAIVYWLLRVRDPGELHLNLGLSCMAAVQGVVLQIAANRGDRISSEVAKGTHENTTALLTMQSEQTEILRRLQALEGLPGDVSGLAEAVRVAMAADGPVRAGAGSNPADVGLNADNGLVVPPAAATRTRKTAPKGM